MPSGRYLDPSFWNRIPASAAPAEQRVTLVFNGTPIAPTHYGNKDSDLENSDVHALSP